MTTQQKQRAYDVYMSLDIPHSKRFAVVADQLGIDIDDARDGIHWGMSREMVGRPAQCFQGAVWLGDDHVTSYPTTQHMHADGQRRRGITGTSEQAWVESYERKHRRAA